jgi:hypothetical protein
MQICNNRTEWWGNSPWMRSGGGNVHKYPILILIQKRKFLGVTYFLEKNRADFTVDDRTVLLDTP